MDFRQSQTYNNLQEAYEIALMANGNFELFEKKAMQEELIEIGLIFNTMSRNEMFIAERLRGILYDGTPDTTQNLLEASEIELSESNNFREYSRIALEEGYPDLASLFSGIANIMLNHNYTTMSKLAEIESGQPFCRDTEGLWLCLGCGHIMSGLCAPEICPICFYPQSYYQLI